MKILHTENSCGWGGQEIRILGEARGMIARGHEVHLVCPREARIHDEALARGVPVTALPIARKNLKGVRALRTWLKSHPFDVINTHSSTDSWLVALACASLRGTAPAVVRTRHISAPVPDNAATRWLYTRAARRIVTTGEALKLQLARDNGFAPSRMVSIPTGIDLEHFRPALTADDKRAARAATGIAPDAFVIGIVATLRSWKGHRYLVEAMARLARQDAVLLIVGDGPQREMLDIHVARLGLGERVRFAGNQGDVLPWLRSMDMFVLPSYANEGVPQAILQAFACALPVITTDAGAIGEVAVHEETAIVVARQDSGALAQAIDRLAADPALRDRLGANALTRVHTRHGASTMLDRMEQVFEEAIDEHGAARKRQ